MCFFQKNSVTPFEFYFNLKNILGQGGSGITCCRDGNIIPPNNRHPDCFPIALSRNDHIFAPFGERCMEFVRSLPAPRPECNFGPREQMNQVTGYLDGSNIYGSNDRAQQELREFRGGRLKIQNVQGRQLLPNNENECSNQIGQACFKAGKNIKIANMKLIFKIFY